MCVQTINATKAKFKIRLARCIDFCQTHASQKILTGRKEGKTRSLDQSNVQHSIGRAEDTERGIDKSSATI
uniref:Ovule protein n=1 Tax=Steinernema glaseri TaxID=37863 RepID=A0A1I7ZG36_9BILA